MSNAQQHPNLQWKMRTANVSFSDEGREISGSIDLGKTHTILDGREFGLKSVREYFTPEAIASIKTTNAIFLLQQHDQARILTSTKSGGMQVHINGTSLDSTQHCPRRTFVTTF